MIKNCLKNRTSLLFTGVLLATAALQLFFSISVQAAGTAVVTVEATSPVQTNTDFQARFYVTASGAHVYTLGFNVNFSGLTFQSYSPGSSPFNGSNSVASGGSAGSTSIQIAASYVGAVPGGQGKILVGNATLRSGPSAGTGAINISGVQAYEYDTDPNNPTAMSGSGQNGSVAIQAPAQPPATCPAGQTGTPPNCTTPPPPPSGGTGGNAGNGGSAATPNPGNSVAVPSDTGGADAPPDVISESDFMAASDDENQEASDTSGTEKKNSGFPLKTVLIIGGGVILAAVVAIGVRLFLLRRSRANELAGHIVVPPAGSTISTTPPAPTNSDKPEAGQTIFPDNEHKQE